MRDAAQGSERRVIALAMAVAAGMIAQQIASKAARDGFFLSQWSVKALPAVMVASAALSLVVVLAVSRLLSRYSPQRAVPWIFAANGALFAVEYVLAQTAARPAAVVLYLHTSALGAAAISSFWSVITERFDPRAAKRAIARVAVGATFGGVVGGLAAWQLANRVSIPVLLLVLGGMNVISAVGIARVGRGASHDEDEGPAPSGFRVLKETPYLQMLAVMVVLGALAEVSIDFVFKASAQAQYSSPESLVTFFAIFYTATSVLTFLLQSTVVERTLRAVGLTGAVAFRPALMIGGGVLALAFPRLWAATVLRGSDQTAENSFYRSGYEILYTPLTPEKKRPTKTMIDVGVEKLGVAAGSALVLIIVALAPSQTRTILLGVAVGCGSLGLLVCSRLHGGYVGALADSLRAGVIKLEPDAKLDRTTMYTLSQTATAIDRATLLAEIDKLRARKLSDTGSATAILAEDGLVTAVSDLRSGDTDRVLGRLRAGPLDLRLVGHVIPLLERRPMVTGATEALIAVAADCVGQLTDALVGTTTPGSVRRRLPKILQTVPSERAVAGLCAGLADPVFDVRERCAAAVLALTQDKPDLGVAPGLIYAAVIREASASAPKRARKLEHLATLLGVVLDHGPIQLAFRALASDDHALRATGMEYLENVVPAHVFAALEPALEAPKRPSRPARPAGQVMGELLTSVDTRGIDLAAVRAHIRAKEAAGPLAAVDADDA